MDGTRLTRSYLETLSTGDLAKLAADHGIDVPENLNRVFVISEILDACMDEQEEEEYADPLEDKPESVNADGLPPSYNETFIGVLLRDPVWAYAFWEIKVSDRELRESDPRFDGYRLRVSSLSGPRGNVQGDSFSIPIDREDNAWYLCLPSGTGWYRVDLVAAVGAAEEVLAHSFPVRVPRGGATPAPSDDSGRASILALSGLEEIAVIKGGDSESRLPQRCEA